MDPEYDDDDDLLSLSERILPLTSASYTNNTSSRLLIIINRNRFNKITKKYFI